MTDNKLKQSLSISQAVGLGITIVVGSGLLLLPGLAYIEAGAASIYAWIICAFLVIPLLIVFSVLVSKYPTAGGVAGFMQNAFSRHLAGATEVMLLGTFGLGIPASALTGSYYFNALFSIDNQFTELLVSLLIIWIAFFINYLGGGISGNIQKALAIILVLALLLVPVLSMFYSNSFDGEGVATVSDVNFDEILPLIGMVFFAFTGWEILSFTIEEYKNPKRDYPISVGVSFIIVAILYLLLVLSIQLIIPLNYPSLNTAPLSALSQYVFGSPSGKIISLLSFIIILANIIGAIWAASRLVFSSAREGLLPITISYLSKNKVPRISLIVTCSFFSIILICNYYGFIKVNDLLRLAGQNFFILYGMAVLAYLKIVRLKSQKIFGFATLLIVVGTMGTFGIELLYPITLLTIGYLVSKYKTQNK